MSRFLLLGDILSLSEAKGTQTRFLGRLKVAAFADVMHARIQSESEYKWKKISRFQNRNSFSLSLSLSLSPKRKRNAETLSLFSLSLSLYVWSFLSFVQRRCVLSARTERERERERERWWFARGVSSLSLKSVSLCCWIFEKVTNFSFEQSGVEKKRKFFRIYSTVPRDQHTTVNEEAQNAFLLTRAALTTNTILILTL